jgi:small subunit ribosomal protein S17
MNEEVIQQEPQAESAVPTATGEVAAYKGRRKVRVGVVVSDKMDKTVVVAVMRSYRHPIYKKTIRRTKKYMAHDEQNQCRVGDRVEIVETRPLSRHKRWRVRQILERAQ